MAGADDAKIAELVRTVLHAVDLRLEQVRTEVHALAVDVERRHAEVLQLVRDLDQRIEARAAETAAAGGNDPLAARMEQATQMLLERIEAMQQRNTMATNERFAQVNAAIDQMRGSSIAAPLAVPATERISPLKPAVPAVFAAATAQGAATSGATPSSSTLLADIAAVSAPLRPSPTAMGPVIEPIAVAGAAAAESESAEVLDVPGPFDDGGRDGDGDAIDLDRLGDLLAERLAHLKLPTRD